MENPFETDSDKECSGRIHSRKEEYEFRELRALLGRPELQEAGCSVAESNKVFVYGTLRRGFPLHNHLRRGSVRLLGRAKTRGRLYDLGDFPGAWPSQSWAYEIEGELYEFTNGAQLLRELDEVEEYFPERANESLFLRRLANVELESGKKVKAWVYYLADKPANARLIPSGDYAEARRSRS